MGANNETAAAYVGGQPMATESVNYQCPSCMGPLHFEGADGKLHCDYCDGAFTPAEVEAGTVAVGLGDFLERVALVAAQ